MKDYCLWIIACFFLNTSVTAQVLVLNHDTLFFNPTTELQTDSQAVRFYNNTPFAVTVFSPYVTTTYGQAAFHVSPDSFVVQPTDSQTIMLYFHPRHNIYHDAEMIFRTLSDGDNSYAGEIRLNLKGQGKFSNPYYNTTENLSEEDLKQALKARIALGYVSQGYSNRILMFSTFDNWKVNGRGSSVDKVECVYTGRTIENYPMNTGTLVNSPWNFNTEHTFPQAFFSSNEPMRSDFFHLFPTDESINNTRGNMPFGEVSNPIGQNGGSQWDNTYFEPRDAHKGAAARAMMYFVLRYQDYNNFFAPQEATLRQWHFQFPPDNIEKTRCQNIYTYQQNRNPFIDYPQFLERITKLVSTSSATPSYSWYLHEDTIRFGTKAFNQDWYYAFYLLNTGNQPLSIQNSALNNSALSFVQGGNDTIIQPGEALPITLRLNSNQPLTANFSCYFPAIGYTLNVPITYHPLTTSSPIASNQTTPFVVYPNPVSDRLYITPLPDEQLACYDLVGKEYSLTPQGDFYEVHHLPAGLYFMFIENQAVKFVVVK